MRLHDLVQASLRVGETRSRRPLPFQVTMRRFGRKLDVEAERAKLPLAPFFFDILMAEGEELIDRSVPNAPSGWSKPCPARCASRGS